MKTILIVGLGNPGDEFEKTRHNIGRETALFIRKHVGFADFRFEKKWAAWTTEKKTGKTKAVLLLPDTFMNKSGNAVGPAARFYKIKPADIFLIHDDADIPFGAAKLSFGKNSAGHKGVESVMRAIKTKNFWRFRIGIGGRRDIPAEKLVLKKFSTDEEKKARTIIKKTAEAFERAATDGPEKAMNEYNKT